MESNEQVRLRILSGKPFYVLSEDKTNYFEVMFNKVEDEKVMPSDLNLPYNPLGRVDIICDIKYPEIGSDRVQRRQRW